jgi:PAS domain-containing protein
VHNSDSSILISNPKASKILGLTREQMSGKMNIDPAWNFIHEDSHIMKVEDYPVNRVLSTPAILGEHAKHLSKIVVNWFEMDHADKKTSGATLQVNNRLNYRST